MDRLGSFDSVVRPEGLEPPIFWLVAERVENADCFERSAVVLPFRRRAS